MIARGVARAAEAAEAAGRLVFVVVLAGLVGFSLGVWLEGRTLWRLFDLPVGNMTATIYPSVIWQRVGPRTLIYQPLPTWSQARAVELFGPVPPPVVPPPAAATPSPEKGKVK